jgi:stress response protein SCP2
MFKISLNRVHDKVEIKEGDEKIMLHVDSDPMRMVAGLSQAQKMLQELNKDSSDEETDKAAQYFATVIFGKEQAETLVAFYHNDAACVINVCGQYFSKRLGKLITNAQKKMK